MRVLRNCGQREKYHHVTLSGNHRLDTLQAAILRVKLRHLDRWNDMRRHAASLYDQLTSSSRVTMVTTADHNEPVYHLYVIQVDDRDALQASLTTEGIGTGIHYPIPIHLQPAYSHLGYHEGDFPVTELSAKRMLSLPMFAELKSSEIEFVLDSIWFFLRGGRIAQPNTGRQMAAAGQSSH